MSDKPTTADGYPPELAGDARAQPPAQLERRQNSLRRVSLADAASELLVRPRIRIRHVVSRFGRC